MAFEVLSTQYTVLRAQYAVRVVSTSKCLRFGSENENESWTGLKWLFRPVPISISGAFLLVSIGCLVSVLPFYFNKFVTVTLLEFEFVFVYRHRNLCMFVPALCGQAGPGPGFGLRANFCACRAGRVFWLWKSCVAKVAQVWQVTNRFKFENAFCLPLYFCKSVQLEFGL